MGNIKFKDYQIILTTIILLGIIVLITVPWGLLDVTDLSDYSDTAKYFAGDYQASHRTTHSMLYGLMLSPYVKLTHSFQIIKFASVFWLSLIILSLYYISKKNRKTLILFVTFPLVWYLAPWLSPVPISALLFLWAYHFLKKFDLNHNFRFIIYSGLSIGIASSFWDSSLYFGIIFLISFFYNKELYLSWLFIISLIIGLLPKLLADYIIFGSPIYGLLKFFGALISFGFYGGIYSQGYSSPHLLYFLEALTFVPFYFYIFYRKKRFIQYKKEIIFLTLSILLILTNPQPRPVFTIAPIIILLLGQELNDQQVKIQAWIFIFLSLLVITPYLIQSHYETSLKRFTLDLNQYKNFKISSTVQDKLIIEDLDKIGREYPNQLFVVGADKDYYRTLAHLYWEKNIKKFISIEDYNLAITNKSVITTKRWSSHVPPSIRRDIWIEIGLEKSLNDETDYKSIKYGLGFEDNLGLDDFKLIKKYNKIYLFERQLS